MLSMGVLSHDLRIGHDGQSRKRAIAAIAAMVLAGLTGASAASASSEEETIVMLRHGEKPAAGLGQLDCQGLNRALKLPDILSKFGKPNAIFAPNPTQQAHDGGNFYYYVRPLATIEPTAIRLGMPVNTKFGYRDIQDLEQELLDPKHAKDTIFVTWEHKKLHAMVVDLVMKSGLPKTTVMDWPDSEYDRIDVLKVTHEGQTVKAKYEEHAEGLNGAPTTCP